MLPPKSLKGVADFFALVREKMRNHSLIFIHNHIHTVYQTKRRQTRVGNKAQDKLGEV